MPVVPAHIVTDGDVEVEALRRGECLLRGVGAETLEHRLHGDEGDVAIIAEEFAGKCLEICRKHPLGSEANIIGRVHAPERVPTVEMNTKIGGRRIVQMPYGRELPRIC